LLAALSAAALTTAAPARAAVHLDRAFDAQSPVHLAHAGDKRLFVVELAGRIRLYDRATSTMSPTPFLDLSTRVTSGNERGLWALAFHPDFLSNGFFYVSYSGLTGDTVVERYRVNGAPATATTADPASATRVLLVPQPSTIHKAGQLAIGPHDGYLYVSTGDGGPGGDPSCNAQRKDLMLGKLLRLDVRQNLTQAPFYGIPADNPFVSAADPGNQTPDEIWALGLRNPWRFGFDRNGDLFIGDVGEDDFEEIDFHRVSQPAGQNFGWKVMEGSACYESSGCAAGTPACGSAALTAPIHAYPHSGGDCSVTGGHVVRGSRVPELEGRYVFGDFCSGAIRTLREVTTNNWQATAVAEAPGSVTSFGQDADGNVYFTSNDAVWKITSDTPATAVSATSVPALAALTLALAAAAFLLRRRGN
jgi:glucose/arabinose dehydrogenase